MSTERATQNRVIALFRDELGYRFLGDRSDWTNSNIDEALLTAWLRGTGKYTKEQISRAIYLLRTEADNPNRSLYENNKAVYALLRYGVPVKIEAGKVTETVWLVDWTTPQNNDFVIVEEVTLRGGLERRPDLVLYVNGIAISVIELKNSHISIGNGIRQLLSNQKKQFNEWFFSTVQVVFAGNDSEGLRYGTIKTEEKYFLTWKEDEEDDSRFKLDKYLLRMCRKDRLIELIHDYMLFDGGVKKLPRVHQYFGNKAAQIQVKARKGGIIWQTQGSGKSILMVLLAKWILENLPTARVAIVTDRDELDKQIERVFNEMGEPIKRTTSGRDLMTQLGQATPRLLCSLVHKFGRRDVDDFDAFIRELEAMPCKTVGEIFVFVDECHRTQSGKLHRVMKAIMPNAVFIGFTGTPLLKKDKQTSMEVFGGYIHTYKFGEAVADKVVLDLIYEARDIDQRLGSQEKIDAWFEAKTKSLNAWQKDELKSKWGTMQVVLSSKSRMGRVVSDIVFDFSVKPRLSSERGNAILIASSIHEACKYFTLFQKTPLKGKCAVVTSYNPLARDVTLEETGANTETDKQFIYNTYTNIADELDLAGYTAADIARIKHQQDAYLKLREIIRMASGESLDLKAYEADMRHLIDTYIEADEPRTISDFGDISLLDLIVKTGMDKAIGSNLGGLKGDRNAIAETIENNVRSRIIKEQLNDPAYYERMSELLKEIIAARKSNAISYEKYLKKIADLVNQVHAGQPDDTPEPLKRSPALRAIYNNLGKSGDGTKLGDVELEPGGTGDRRLDLALRIDNTIRITRSDDWRGVQARELFIKQALFGILGDVDEVERLFLVIMQQREY